MSYGGGAIWITLSAPEQIAHKSLLVLNHTFHQQKYHCISTSSSSNVEHMGKKIGIEKRTDFNAMTFSAFAQYGLIFQTEETATTITTINKQQITTKCKHWLIFCF
ncbi:unnamed protein product [Brugia pahangi]|uniref:Histidine kinase n=1 Tax=Brugia pahangi TaxID=6280 RepID=A0A0N4TPT6_BRUPA|nr:unnamed protein product [Brugia pahangi]